MYTFYYASKKFEKQIKRIHDLIEQPGSRVTWNDHIPDPDNPVQPRQIDITINRDNSLTIIECRIHAKKQDVKWIEELIGRRMSLKADAVIAVSASGFTEGAIKKAKAYGIILRDILSLTEEEICEWGQKTKVWLTFYNYRDICLTFFFDKAHENQISMDEVFNDLQQNKRLFGIFNKVSEEIFKTNPTVRPCCCKIMLHNDNMLLSGRKILDIKFEANFKAIKKTLNIPSVVAYDAPDTVAINRNVLIEKVDFGNFEIIKSSNKVSLAYDLSPVKAPANSLFRFVECKFKRPLSIKSCTILSPPKWEIQLRKIKIGLAFI